jgi:hypothetical protein
VLSLLLSLALLSLLLVNWQTVSGCTFCDSIEP